MAELARLTWTFLWLSFLCVGGASRQVELLLRHFVFGEQAA